MLSKRFLLINNFKYPGKCYVEKQVQSKDVIEIKSSLLSPSLIISLEVFLHYTHSTFLLIIPRKQL